MSNSTYFDQECPTCGRRLYIRVVYLGKKVVCDHCRGEFVACDPESSRYPAAAESADALLRRADELLQHARRKTHVRASHPR